MQNEKWKAHALNIASALALLAAATWFSYTVFSTHAIVQTIAPETTTTTVTTTTIVVPAVPPPAAPAAPD